MNKDRTQSVDSSNSVTTLFSDPSIVIDKAVNINMNISFTNDFILDAARNLGRANGNVYRRKSPVEDVHDGQLMVRLKKKRFIVIDYSFIPTPVDVKYAENIPHLICPIGAGSRKCIGHKCTKIGVPVMLYDSNPEEPSSLYLRSGMCFCCQRILNEKRRTQRKKKGANNSAVQKYTHLDTLRSDFVLPGDPTPSFGLDVGITGAGIMTPTFVPPTKRIRLNGDILDLNPDAIIINGPLEGTKNHTPGCYEYKDIIHDLVTMIKNAAKGAVELANMVTSNVSISPDDLSSSSLFINSNSHSATLTLYKKTFLSMSQAIFLLSQWKRSWDDAVVTAAAKKVTMEHSFDSGVFADVVASAAAVAAAARSVVNNTHTNNNPNKNHNYVKKVSPVICPVTESEENKNNPHSIIQSTTHIGACGVGV